MPFVSITRLRVRSWTFLPSFFLTAVRTAVQARAADGNLAVLTLRDADNTFWTQSLWRDEAAMRAYMLAGAHAKAMPKLIEWCDEASVAHWTQDETDPVSWDEVHRRMQQNGRPSRVRYPSQAQKNFSIPAPVVRPHGSELRFK